MIFRSAQIISQCPQALAIKLCKRLKDLLQKAYLKLKPQAHVTGAATVAAQQILALMLAHAN